MFDQGFAISSDRGDTWETMSPARTYNTANVRDLVVHPRDNVIVIATHGRGM